MNYRCMEIIQQIASYLTLGDLRPSSALKLTLGISQHKKISPINAG